MKSEIPENAGEFYILNDPLKDITPSEPIQRTSEEIEEKRRILEQVEYYFGDKNFPKDKFLKELCSKDPQRWVQLAIVRQFKKMQVYKDDALIVEALRESPEILEVDDSGTKIRRKTPIRMPIPEHVKSGPMWKSIYTKSIEDFFKKYGKVVKVTPRKDNEKFKGSYFIQFETHEEAKKISEMELFFNDVKLTIMMKFDYCEMKCVEKGLDPDTMRKQIPHITKKHKLDSFKYEKNCLLRFEGVGPNVRWEDIKAKMETDYGSVVFVKLDQQLRSGIIHFESPIALKVVSSIQNDNLEFDGFKPVFKALEGEDEKLYYLNRRKFMEETRKKSSYNQTKRNNAQRTGDNDVTGNADCSSTSVIGYKRKLDDAYEAEKSSATKSVKLELEETGSGSADCSSTSVIGYKRKLDDADEAEKSSAAKSLDDVDEAEKSPAAKSVKLEET
ncbi:9554_t:CDS:2, partial [Racocetra persica]